MCKFDIISSTLSEALALLCSLKVGLHAFLVTLAGSDDSLKISDAWAVALAKGSLSFCEVTCKDVCESGSKALLACELRSGSLVVTLEDFYSCSVLDSSLSCRCSEVLGSLVKLVLAESEHAENVLHVSIVCVALCDGSFAVSVLAGVCVNNSEVVLSGCA